MKMTMMIVIINITIMSSSPSLPLSPAAAARSSELFRSAYIILHMVFATGARLYEITNNTVTYQN
jgi:hypothetical protein